MNGFFQFFAVIGPMGFVLVPLSIVTSTAVFYALF